MIYTSEVHSMEVLTPQEKSKCVFFSSSTPLFLNFDVLDGSVHVPLSSTSRRTDKT